MNPLKTLIEITDLDEVKWWINPQQIVAINEVKDGGTGDYADHWEVNLREGIEIPIDEPTFNPLIRLLSRGPAEIREPELGRPAPNAIQLDREVD